MENEALYFNITLGQDIEVLYAALITCPWYTCTQRERGEQAKHNTIFVVYQTKQDQFLAPINDHLVDQTNVVDKVQLIKDIAMLF